MGRQGMGRLGMDRPGMTTGTASEIAAGSPRRGAPRRCPRARNARRCWQRRRGVPRGRRRGRLDGRDRAAPRSRRPRCTAISRASRRCSRRSSTSAARRCCRRSPAPSSASWRRRRRFTPSGRRFLDLMFSKLAMPLYPPRGPGGGRALAGARPRLLRERPRPHGAGARGLSAQPGQRRPAARARASG